jgi:hypothetical protein
MYIDIGLLVVWGLVTWCVAGEGAFGAAVSCACVLFSALLAMNFFEPFANFAERYLITDWSMYWDFIALCGLFAACVTGLRFLCDYLSPRYPQMVALAEDIGRWGFGLVAGYVTMAFLLTSLHTAPLPREFLGFTPERKNLFNLMAPDRQWLGFTQFVSEHALSMGGQPHVFDGPNASFIQAPADQKPNTVWPSFPIRYATRRAQFSGAIAPVRPVTAPPPSGGNQGRPSTPGAGGF